MKKRNLVKLDNDIQDELLKNAKIQCIFEVFHELRAEREDQYQQNIVDL